MLVAKNQKPRLLLPAIEAFNFLFQGSPKLSHQRGWQVPHVHASCCRFFVFRSRSAGNFAPVSIQIDRSHCGGLSTVMPLGFCCGGFTSTGGYVPANEAPRTIIPKKRVFAGRLSCTSSGRSFPGRRPWFLSRGPGCFSAASCTSLSASAPSVPDSGFPLLLPSNDRVTASAPPLDAGQNARRQFRL